MDKYGPFENEFRFVFFAPPEKYEATFAFYRDALGLPHTGGFGEDPAGMRGVFLQAAAATIEIITDPTDSFLRRQIMQPDQVYQPALGGHLLIEVEDVDSRFTQARAAGAPVIQPLTNWPWDFRDFKVADPCGNIVCLFSRLRP
jgi:predicted enzyme related to lactoylglutathione lyase